MTQKQVHQCSLDGRPVSIVQRSAESGYGPVPEELYYECDIGHDWPRVRIRARRGFLWGLLRGTRAGGLKLDDPEFNAAFRVDAENEDFAIALLSTEMQRFLLDKRTVDWSIGHGSLKLFYRGGLKRKKLPQSLDRMRRFLAHIPNELAAWYLRFCRRPRPLSGRCLQSESPLPCERPLMRLWGLDLRC